MSKKRLLVLGVLTAVTLMVSSAGAQGSRLNGEGLTVGYTTPGLDNEYWAQTKAYAEAEADRLGVNLVFLAAETGDVSDHLDIINDFIAQGVDAVVIAPVDSKGIIPGIEALNAAGIPVVGADILPEGGHLIAKVQVDARVGGRLVGEYILSQKGPDGKLFLEDSDVYVDIGEIRHSGAYTLLQENGWEVVRQPLSPYGRGPAQDMAETVFTAHPDLDAYYTLNDDTALGVVQAAQAMGMTDVVICGYDALPEAVEAIRNGQMGCTIYQDANALVSWAIQMAVLYNDAPWAGTVEYYIPPTLVTPDNVDSYK
ncbi:MAG: sugar ABC transporter substrate-binding protein [Chloroflexota bacterium]|jgi:ribose transport system substrate-binding protein